MKQKKENSVKLNKVGNLSFLLLILLFLFLGADKIYGAESPHKFPLKSIKFIVPASAGGSLGNEIRAIAPFLEKTLGVKTVVEYITGADGMIAYNKFPSERSDGYTLLYFNLNSAISIELTRSSAKYEISKLTPIAAWNVKRHALVVNSDSWTTFQGFFNDAKQRNISMTLTGGSATLQGYLMEVGLGVKFNFVPFGSAGESLAAIAGKHVEGGIQFTYPPKPLIRAGKLRSLAVFSPVSDPVLPDVPTLKALGFGEVPCMEAYGTFMAPPNTPKEVVKILENAVSKAAANPELSRLGIDIGMAPGFISSQDLRKMVSEHYELINKYKQFLK